MQTESGAGAPLDHLEVNGHADDSDDQHEAVSPHNLALPSTPERPQRSQHRVPSPVTPLSPATGQDSPLSPRVLAVQALRRAASLREGTSSSPMSSPRVANLGLERSASDAARRMAMAKLTGEKITAPREYTQPNAPLPAGPPPSLADLQARAEQRLALASPEMPTQTSLYSPSHSSPGLSRNPSICSTALSRSASAASSAALSRNASLARSRGAMSPISSNGEMAQDPGNEDDEQQKKTDERQEARSNLIRKLSRGRLAQGAAAGARERAGLAGGEAPAGDGAATPFPPGTSGSGLKRRPSLAEVMARAAESRRIQQQNLAAAPPSPMPVPADAQPTSIDRQITIQTGLPASAQPSPFSFTPSTDASSPAIAPSSAASMVDPMQLHRLQSEVLSPPLSASSPSTHNNPLSATSSSKGKGRYDHIPIPPVPETPASSTGSPNVILRTLPSHESIYSAVSNFRPYRHTVERDRDMDIAMQRMDTEDNFEFEMGTEAGPHERHPLSEGEEEPNEAERNQQQQQADPTNGDQLVPPALPFGEGYSSSRGVSATSDIFSPPDSPLDARMIRPHAAQQPDHIALTHAGQMTLSPLAAQSSPSPVPSVSPIQRTATSMPETPEAASPISPFSFTPAPPHTGLAPTFSLAQTPNESYRQGAVQDTAAVPSSPPRAGPFSFLKQHNSNMSTDSFPVSVAGSHASRHPHSLAFAFDNAPGMPGSAEPPLPSNESSPEPQPSSEMRAASETESGPAQPWPQSGPASSVRSPVTSSGTPTFPVAPLDTSRARVQPIPVAEYRFPTAGSGRRDGSRPASLASNDGLDRRMDRMIDQLEALQAETPASPKPHKQTGGRPGLAAALDIFAAQAQEDNKHISSIPMQSQDSATALHEFHASHEEPALHVPHEIPRPPLNTQQSSTLPIPPASPADYVKYSNAKLAPFPGIHDLERQRSAPGSPKPAAHLPASPGHARQPSTDRPAYQGSSKLAQAVHAHHQKLPPAPSTGLPPVPQAAGYAAQEQPLAVPSARPPHHERQNSDASGQHDSAPSLARTGSSSSGDSNGSDALPPIPPRQSSVSKEQVMQRLSDLLSPYSRPKEPTALDVPPRQLLLHSPVLQVVNANTVKDRYLFLFTDILVIAKPLIEEDAAGEPIPPTLATRYLVKSIVELPKLKLTAQANESTEEPIQKRKHPLLLTFVDRFANDPRKAVSALIAKAGLSNDAATIANLLFRNPELNRSQLGAYLSMREHKPVLKAYCDRFRMAGVRIEDALRVFITSMRLPNDYAAAEYLLSVFASQWLANNPGTGMTNDSVFASKLVISIMELNDALHSGIDDETAAAGNLFSFPNHAITVDDFIAAFRLKDPHGALPDEHLTRIYLSIRKDRVQQAADNSIAALTPEIEVVMHPTKLPSRLTYRSASENISLTLPQPDSKLSIRLVGQDLRFEPSVLTFARSRTATFRITPTALGNKSMLFVKLGATSTFYRNVPVNKTFSVERAFMNHTFQIAFVNHLGVKRKYLFSMGGADAKFTWVETLRKQIETAPVVQEDTPRATKVADAVSLQVLRDALIAPEEPVPVLVNTKPAAPNYRPGFVTPPASRNGLRSAAGLQRSNSISKTYAHGLGRAEADLGEGRRPSGTLLPGAGAQASTALGRRGSRDDTVVVQSRSGNEIITMVQQNSLLPLVLGLASAGAGIDAMPRKPVLPAAPPTHASPQMARGTGRFRNL